MREKLLAIVKSCVDEINEDLDYDSLRNVTEETILFGGDDGLDSLSLVALIAAVEQELENEFRKQFSLSDEKALSMNNSPYRTVGSLIDFIVPQLDDNYA